MPLFRLQASGMNNSEVKRVRPKIYLLYYPNDDVTKEDLEEITRTTLDQDEEISIIDINEMIKGDQIQNTGKIEMNLDSGKAKCILLLTSAAKSIFDHIRSGGSDER